MERRGISLISLSLSKWRARYAPGPPFFSCDPSPGDTTQIPIHINQKFHLAHEGADISMFRRSLRWVNLFNSWVLFSLNVLVLGVSSVYLYQFVADVAFRCCSIRDRTVLSVRCSLRSKMARRSEGRPARIYGHSSSI